VGIKIEIPEDQDEGRALTEIRRILSRHPGDTPVLIVSPGSGRKFKTNKDLWISTAGSFYDELADIIDAAYISTYNY
jgi:frataxin-like iron-binding protein CyaY